MMNELSIKAAIPNHHKLSGSKQVKCIASEFWRLRVWNTGVGRTTLSLKALGEGTSLSRASFQWLQTILGTPCWQTHYSALRSIITSCSPCASVSGSRFLFPYRDTSHIGFRAHPNSIWPHRNLITSAKTIFPNKVTFLGSAWTSVLRDTIQPSKKVNGKQTYKIGRK